MAQIIALGKKTVAAVGTLVQLTTTEGVHAWAVRASEDNTGKIYIGLAGFTTADYVGIFWELNPGETFSSVSSGLNDINPSKVYLDTETSGNFLTGVLQVR